MSLLSETERTKIEETVRLAEANTAGELVVVVTPRSDSYALFRGAFALGLAFLLAQEGHQLLPELGVSGALWVFLGLVVLLFFVLSLPPLLRLIVPRSERAARALERATRAFVETGVTETEARSGVLIFLSEAEHEVIVLADKGIHQRVPEGQWDKEVATLVQGLKAKRASEGLERAIEEIGALLALHFPPSANDRNELADEVRDV